MERARQRVLLAPVLARVRFSVGAETERNQVEIERTQAQRISAAGVHGVSHGGNQPPARGLAVRLPQEVQVRQQRRHPLQETWR